MIIIEQDTMYSSYIILFTERLYHEIGSFCQLFQLSNFCHDILILKYFLPFSLSHQRKLKLKQCICGVENSEQTKSVKNTVIYTPASTFTAWHSIQHLTRMFHLLGTTFSRAPL